MKFVNDFQVEAPVDEVYEAMLDLERVAPAMPGAQVTDKVGDDAYKVAIKVKLGPMTMNYKGDVTIGEKDPEAHRATLHVKVREARGQGNATAQVLMRLQEQDGATAAHIEAEVQLAGKAAAMGRGLIEDVSAKLVDQFASNLATMLASSGGEEAASTNGGETAAKPAGDGDVSGEGAAAAEREAAQEKRRAAPPKREQPQFERQDSIDAFALAGGVTSDKLRDPKVLGGVLLVVLLLGWLLGRRG
jgi:carbon monoxide dehydrogenase subunit G